FISVFFSLSLHDALPIFSYAMSSTFIFDILMIILFPLFGRWLLLSDVAYGLWTGTAVNDTSSVVAAGYAFSEAAGDFATMVKLTDRKSTRLNSSHVSISY